MRALRAVGRAARGPQARVQSNARRGPVGRAIAIGSIATASVCAPERDARADVEWQLASGAGAMWMRSLPELKSPQIETSARVPLRESSITTNTSLFGLGAFVEGGLTVDDRLVLPLAGFGFWSALGSYDSVLTGLDGSFADVRPWTTFRIDVLLPGIGVRAKKRRWMFAAGVRGGLSYFETDASVAGAVEWVPVVLKTVTPLVQAEIEACRRLDPVTRLCLYGSPRVYDGSFMNGAIFGLRVEWGR